MALVSPLTPEQAATFPFTPPLGTQEAVVLSREVRRQLDTALRESPLNEVRLLQCRRALDEIILFTMEEDRRTGAFDAYTWYRLGSREVTGGEAQRTAFRLETPLERVGAVAFRAEGGRVVVEGIRVADSEDRDGELSRTSLYLRRDVPKREVVYLYEPGPLKSVEATLATDETSRTTVVAYAGVPKSPEHGKRALMLLRKARRELDEFRLREAAAHLVEAESELLRFREEHALKDR